MAKILYNLIKFLEDILNV